MVELTLANSLPAGAVRARPVVRCQSGGAADPLGGLAHPRNLALGRGAGDVAAQVTCERSGIYGISSVRGLGQLAMLAADPPAADTKQHTHADAAFTKSHDRWQYAD